MEDDFVSAGGGWVGTGMEVLLGEYLKILTWSNRVLILHSPSDLQGVTFRVEGGELVIARILHGGMVAQQGLLHVGDIIKEVNGQPVGSDPRALQELLRNASGSVILKILPSYQEPHLPRQVGPSTSPSLSRRPKGWPSLLAVRVASLTEALLSYWFPPGEMRVGPAAQGQLTAAADRPLPLLHLHVLPRWPALCMQPQPGVAECMRERLHRGQRSSHVCVHAQGGWRCRMSWTTVS